jgi:opacity protein-like surface antigen
MNKKWLVAMLGATAMTMSAGAIAQQKEQGFYAGAEIGQTDFEDADKDTAFKFFGGYQINRTFAAELGYSNLYDKDGVEATAWELMGVAKMPVGDKFSVYGKLGFAMWEVEGFGEKFDGTDLTYAIGLQYDLSRNLGLRAQWQRYDVETDADVLSIGLVYRF